MTATLVIGHNAKRKGATNYLGEKEYDFNKRVAFRVSEILNSRVDVLCKNDMTSYENTLRHRTPEIAIELHFNYFGGLASGCEALSLEPLADADALLYLLSVDFNLRNRGVKYLKPEDRGYRNLEILKKYCSKSFILEPCFQSDKVIFENEEAYALLIANFLRDYLPQETKTIKQEKRLWKKLLAFLWGLLRS